MTLPAHAQTLEEFLLASEQQNVDVRLGAVSALRAELDLNSSWGALLPTLSASGGWTRNQYTAIITIPSGPGGALQTATIVPRNQLDASLQAQVPLLDAERWLKTASAVTSASAAQERQRNTLDQVRRQVVTGFYAYVGSLALLDSTRKSLEAALAQLQEEQLRREAGTATDLELLRARAEVESNRQVLADAETGLANNGRVLETLTGLTPRNVPRMRPANLAEQPAVESFEERTDTLPAVREAALEWKAAQQTHVATGLELVPSVNGQFTQRFTNATGFQGATALWNAGLNFNWQLDMVHIQAIRSADKVQQTAALNLEKARNQARDQIYSDWQHARSARIKVQAASAQVESARGAAALAQQRHAGGMANQVDVIQADRDLLTAEVSDIQARFELSSARALLQLSAGLPMEQSHD